MLPSDPLFGKCAGMEILDLGQIERLGGLGRPEILEILNVLLDDLPAQVDLLAGQLEQGDRESFRASIHRLKGSAMMCGFAALGQQAKEWEEASEANAPLPSPRELREILTGAGAEAKLAMEAAATGE